MWIDVSNNWCIEGLLIGDGKFMEGVIILINWRQNSLKSIHLILWKTSDGSQLSLKMFQSSSPFHTFSDTNFQIFWKIVKIDYCQMKTKKNRLFLFFSENPESDTQSNWLKIDFLLSIFQNQQQNKNKAEKK